MTHLEFKDELTENPFASYNTYSYDLIKASPFYFFPEKNYPFILKSGVGDSMQLQFSTYNYQLRNRLLNSKRLKEIMNTSHIPILINMKGKLYLIGKGFLAEYCSILDEIGEMLFVACVNRPNVTSIDQVTFFISKKIYEDKHKAFHLIFKELIAGHTGDIVVCKNILDYISETISFPKGGTLTERSKYSEALVKAVIEETIRITVATQESLLP